MRFAESFIKLMRAKYEHTIEFLLAQELCRVHWRSRLYKGKQLLTVKQAEQLAEKVNKNWINFLPKAGDLMPCLDAQMRRYNRRESEMWMKNKNYIIT